MNHTNFNIIGDIKMLHLQHELSLKFLSLIYRYSNRVSKYLRSNFCMMDQYGIIRECNGWIMKT